MKIVKFIGRNHIDYTLPYVARFWDEYFLEENYKCIDRIGLCKESCSCYVVGEIQSNL